MKRIKCGNKKGFTIIETSLVLAIAGLILVMAFIALPALQRQQRDTKRKDDTMLFVQAIKKYQQNNRGSLPTTSFISSDKDEANSISVGGWENNPELANSSSWARFYNDYLGDDFKSPDGNKYGFWLLKCGVNVGAVCSPNGNSYDSLTGGNFEDRGTDWFVFVEAMCEDGKPVKSSNNRNVAVVVKLETGGAYCANT